MDSSSYFDGVLGSNVHSIWIACSISQNSRTNWICPNEMDPVHHERRRLLAQNLSPYLIIMFPLPPPSLTIPSLNSAQFFFKYYA